MTILNACGGGGGSVSNNIPPQPNSPNAVFTLTCDINVTQLCSQFNKYTLYVNESNTLIKSISVGLNTPVTISNLKYNTNYTVFSNGIANAKDNIFAKVTSRSFKAGDNINLVITKLESVNSYQVNFNISTSDSLPINTKITYVPFENNNQFSYVNQYDVSNGNNQFHFANNDKINFTINNVNGYSLNIESGLITISQDYNIIFTSNTPPSSKIKNWPNYLAMGAVGGPGGYNNFDNVYIDAVFKYGGESGNGDQGKIVAPLNVYSMYKDLNLIASNNNLPVNITMVEYTAEYSTNDNVKEFTNVKSSDPLQSNIMLKHFISLGLDTIALNKNPIVLNNKNYYGSIILNPDLIGRLQQIGINDINNTLQNATNNLNLALKQMTCFLTKNNVQYTYNSVQYNDTAYNIFESILKVNYNDAKTAWNDIMPTILENCIQNPNYDTTKYNIPNLEGNFNGWIQANNWIIKIFGQNNISFGWQDNIWAVNSGSWLNVNRDLTENEVGNLYSTALLTWIKNNVPAIYDNGIYKPDFFVFDRYERDDSIFYQNFATLYNDHSWNNYLMAVNSVSKGLNNIPIMLWQIPGSHVLINNESISYGLDSFNNLKPIFGVSANYFFGDTRLLANLSNVNSVVSSFILDSSWLSSYNFSGSYVDYIKGDNYDWSNGKDKNGVSGLQKAVNSNVFAILWGGGNSTNVIQNFNNKSDNGLLKNVINNYNNPSNPKRVNLLP
jgi:hypothetical protein